MSRSHRAQPGLSLAGLTSDSRASVRLFQWGFMQFIKTSDSMVDPEKVVTVLLVSPFPSDHQALQNLFNRSNWRLFRASSAEEARRLLRQHRIPVVISEARFPSGSWADIVRDQTGYAASLKMIVMYRFSDPHSHVETLRLGAFDVLAKPFDESEVVQSIGFAWLQWKRECSQTRDLMRREPARSIYRAAG
jgi:DNA-binding NtrC family response regulator